MGSRSTAGGVAVLLCLQALACALDDAAAVTEATQQVSKGGVLAADPADAGDTGAGDGATGPHQGCWMRCYCFHEHQDGENEACACGGSAARPRRHRALLTSSLHAHRQQAYSRTCWVRHLAGGCGSMAGSSNSCHHSACSPQRSGGSQWWAAGVAAGASRTHARCRSLTTATAPSSAAADSSPTRRQ